MKIQDAIKKVVTGVNLSKAEAEEVFSEIMTGNATDAQIAAFITALRMKGETVDEITGAASVMRDKATRITPAQPSFIVDTCGTGGDGSNTFNVSTATAFVAAGAGASVAKHGNRSVSSKCGSADVLEALGVKITISADRMKECLDSVGISFLFASSLHLAMKYAIGPRKEIGVRTIFNVLGPLTNPALAPAQLLGVFSADLTEKMAHVLLNMGTKKAYVVHGLDSLDEISISGPTQISEVSDGKVTTYTISPQDYGIKPAPIEAIKGGDASHNAQIIREILNGAQGAQRDIVILNAAFALAASGIAKTPNEGIEMAKESVDKGYALKKLEILATVTNEMSLLQAQ